MAIKGVKKVYFSKVKEAREALKDKALELYEQYDLAIKDALASQQFDVALAAMQWLMEHMPAEADGTKIIDISVDKPKQIKEGGAPVVQIGFKLGGIDQVALPPANVIDIAPEDTDES